MNAQTATESDQVPSSAPDSVLFPTDGPLPPQSLIGREEEVTALVDGLTRGEHQVLVGAPKAGKSSVAGAAVASLRADGWRSVTVELSRTSSLDDLIGRLVPADESQPTDLCEALRSLQAATEAEDRRIVVLIDDIHEIATTQLFGKPEQVAAAVRSALEQAPGVTCLLAGSVQHVMRGLFRSEDGAFHEFGSVSDLSPISPEAWREGLRSGFTERSCDIHDAALDRIIELGDGHPRTTMLIAQGTYERAAGRNTREIAVAQVDDGLRAALATDRAVNESEGSRVRTLGKHTLATALRVATGESAYKHLPPAIARQTLRNLEIAGVVERPRSREWRIANPLFHRYLLGLTDGAEATPDGEGIADAPADMLVEAPEQVTTETAEATPGTAYDPAPAEAEPEVKAGAAYDPAPAEAEPEAKASTDEDSSSTEAVEPPPATSDAAPTVPSEPIALEPGRLSFRHPRPEESDAVGELVAAAMASPAKGGTRASRDAEQWTGRRFGSFVARTVTAAPNRYWQLEAGGKPVGGVVLHRPRALLGPRTSGGIDPLAQVAVLCGVVCLALGGLGLLVAKQAWEWGGMGGLLFGCFLGCLLLVAPLARPVLGRARASLIARRHDGVVFEGLWNVPGAMPTVVDALAAELPGTLLTAYAEKRDPIPAYRALGFRTGPGRVLTGVLDPESTPSVRPRTPRRTRSRTLEWENPDKDAVKAG